MFHHLSALAYCLALLGCTTFGSPGAITPISGTGTITSLPMPTQLSWFRSLRLEGLQTEHHSELGQPAYSPVQEAVWTGSSRGPLYRLSAHNGSVQWSKDVGGVRSPIAHYEGVLYLGADDGRLVAIDGANGERLWSYKVKGIVTERPLITKKSIYIVDGTNAVYSLNRQTGAWQWQYRRDSPRHFAAHGQAAPTLSGTRLYQGFSDGYLVALNATDGGLLWAKDLSAKNGSNPDVDASAIAVADSVYAASLDGGLYCLDPSSGGVRWTLNLDGIIGLAKHEGDLLATLSNAKVVRIDTYKRRIRWETQMPRKRGNAYQATLAGAKLIVGFDQGALYWLDLATGQPLRRFDSGPGFSVPPTFAGGHVFAIDNAAKLYSFRAHRQAPKTDRLPLGRR